MLRGMCVLALVLSLAPTATAVAAGPSTPPTPFDPPAGRPGGTLRPGESVTLISADGTSKLEIGTAPAPAGLKGADVLDTVYSTEVYQYVSNSHWCGPLSPTGWCEVWNYRLYTDFQYDGVAYLYYDYEYHGSVAYSGYSMRDYYETHFTTQTDPNNGYPMTNRSWGVVTIDRWAGNAIVDSCTIHLNNDIHGTGTTDYSWYVASGSCN